MLPLTCYQKKKKKQWPRQFYLRWSYVISQIIQQLILVFLVYDLYILPHYKDNNSETNILYTLIL